MKVTKPDFMDNVYRDVSINLVDVGPGYVRKGKLVQHGTGNLIDSFSGVGFQNEDYNVIVPLWSMDRLEEDKQDIEWQVRNAVDAAFEQDDNPKYCYVVRYNNGEAYGILVDCRNYQQMIYFAYEDLEAD